MTEPEQRMNQIVAAEQIVLGSIMTTDKTLTDVEPIIAAADFYRPAHAAIYTALIALRDLNQPTDPIALAVHMGNNDTLTRAGGLPYLHTCYAAVPSTAQATHYARIIAGAAALRRLQQAQARIGSLLASANPLDAATVVEQARELLAGVDATAPADSMRTWSEVAQDSLKAMDKASNGEGGNGIPTGLHDLDEVLGGLHPGQLIVVGARPGAGKSLLCAGIAQHAAMALKLRVAYWTLEMSETELGMRMLSAGTSIGHGGVKTGNLADDQWTKVVRYVAETDESPLHIDAEPGVGIADIRSRARRLAQQRGGLDLIVVDYLQLLNPPRGENRQVAVAAMSRGLKLLAKELNVPVVVAAQVNRGPEARSDKRPQLSELRESGAIEADADVVILIHRDDQHDPESPRAGEADMIIAKNRNGPTDTVVVAAQLHLSRFVSMAVT